MRALFQYDGTVRAAGAARQSCGRILAPEHDDFIRVAHRCQSVRDDDRRSLPTRDGVH